MKRPFSKNENYLKELRTLLALHHLWVEGKGESPEADAIREAPEFTWQALSEADKKRLRGLSEDLNSICDNPDGKPTKETNPQAQAKLFEANEARHRGEWDRTLELLRRWSDYVNAATLAYLQGSVWDEAGDPETAAVFYRYATSLDPKNSYYRSALLTALQRSNLAEAVRQAEAVLNAPDEYDPGIIGHAAHAIIASAMEMPADAVPTFTRLIPILRRAIQRLEESQFSDFDSSAMSIAFTLLAVCHQQLGETPSAVECYSRALQIDPRDTALLIARGRLNYGINPYSLDDFRNAIKYGSQNVLPYYYLAHHFLKTDQPEECRAMCEQGLLKAASDTKKSELSEWLAMAQSKLGFPRDLVIATFENAIRLDSSNDRARRKLELYLESSETTQQKPEYWDSRSSSVVRSLTLREMKENDAFAMTRQTS